MLCTIEGVIRAHHAMHDKVAFLMEKVEVLEEQNKGLTARVEVLEGKEDARAAEQNRIAEERRIAEEKRAAEKRAEEKRAEEKRAEEKRAEEKRAEETSEFRSVYLSLSNPRNKKRYRVCITDHQISPRFQASSLLHNNLRAPKQKKVIPPSKKFPNFLFFIPALKKV